MSIVMMRQKMNGLLERIERCRVATNAIRNVKIVFSEAMAKNQNRDPSEDDYDDEPHYNESAQSLVNSVVWVFDSHVLDALMEPVDGRNIVHHFKLIESSLVMINILPDTNTVEPSREGWSAVEYDNIIRFHELRIGKVEHILEEISKECDKITDLRRLMPKWIKSSVMGMFGQADLLANVSYTEDDFTWKWPANHKSPSDSQPVVMSTRWLAPLIGNSNAETIVRNLAEIKAASTIPTIKGKKK